MDDITNYLIQKITHVKSGEELELSELLSGNFIESMDLSGPKFIATFTDRYSWLRDEIGVEIGDEVQVRVADYYSRDELDLILDFTVLSMPTKGDDVTLNCMSKDIVSLKKRAVTGRAFNRKPCSYIIQSLLPGYDYAIERTPIVEDYHILQGEYPSHTLRQLSREHGGHIYLSRDTVRFDKLKTIMSRDEADFTYHNNDRKEVNQIINYVKLSTEQVLGDLLNRKYSAWNMKDGWITSGSRSIPFHYSSTPNAISLKNQGVVAQPVLDMLLDGNGGIRAGSLIDIVWNTRRLDAPIDESLPERVVVSTVSHWYSANKYYCRIKTVLPLKI